MKFFSEIIGLPLILLLSVFGAFSIDCGSAYGNYTLPAFEIPSSPNPVGSGARALGMGGSFIAVADDATAASWNPGGLIQLEFPEVSVCGRGVHRIEKNAFEAVPEADSAETISKSSLNYFSAVLPFQVNNYYMVVSVNYQQLYDFHRHWDFTLTNSETNGFTNYEHDSSGALSAYGIAWCIQLTPGLSFGLTLNIWQDGLDKNQWKDQWRSNGIEHNPYGSFPFKTESVNEYSFSGINANLGILWETWIEDRELVIGAVLKTPFKADLKRHHYFNSVVWDNHTIMSTAHSDDIYHESLYMPMSYGVGISSRISDNLTVSMDYYRTQWDDFIYRDQNGYEFYPLARKLVTEAQKPDPTNQLRLGCEYLLPIQRYTLTLLAGLFYDPAPSEGSPDDIYGFSIGNGIGTKKIQFNIAYQFRYGSDINTVILQERGFSQQLEEHTVYSSLIFYF